MSLKRITVIMRKSISLKNPFIIFSLLGPLLFAAIFQFVFGLWKTQPSIAVYESGSQAITAELEATEAVKTVKADGAGDVEKLVRDDRADVGAVFSEGAVERLETGQKAAVRVYVNGDSLASSRTIALSALAGAVRDASPETPLIDFQQVKLGDEKALSFMEMLLPFFVLIIVMLGAYMLPASFVVNEKEKRTLAALLVTPVTISEVLIAFGSVGVVISLAMGMILLLLTVGIAQPLLLLAVFVLGSILGAEWGILMGLAAKDQAALVAYMKAINIFLLAPALFVIFPSWPQWIAKIFPTYYIANPVFRVSIYKDGWAELGWQILVLGGFVVVFAVPVLAVALGWFKSSRGKLLGLTG